MEAHVAVLEKGKADQSQLAQLRELIATKGDAIQAVRKSLMNTALI